MRICRIIVTKRIIEMQSGAVPGLLTQNALSAFGLPPEEVEEFEVDQAGYEAAMDEDPVVIAHELAEANTNDKAARILQEIIDNLPEWQTVSNAIDGAFTGAQRVIIKKGFRVLYLLAKNEET